MGGGLQALLGRWLMLGICIPDMILVFFILLLPVLFCGSEATIRKEKEKPRIGVSQMDNLRGLLGIRRSDDRGGRKY